MQNKLFSFSWKSFCLRLYMHCLLFGTKLAWSTYQIKRVAADFILFNKSRRFLASMKKIFTSIIILFWIKFKSLLPSRSKSHSIFVSIPFISITEIVGWWKRSLRNKSYCLQCGRKCLLSTMPVSHLQAELLQSKLCLNLCSLSALNSTRSLISFLMPSILRMSQ